MIDTVPTPVEVLGAAGVPYRLHRHPSLVSADDLFARYGWPPHRMLKTIVFGVRGDDGDGTVLVTLPTDRRLAYGRLARELGVARSRLRPATEGDLAALGAEPGGVSPVTAFGRVTVVFDASVALDPVAYCGSGRAGETIELATADLIRQVDPRQADIADRP